MKTGVKHTYRPILLSFIMLVFLSCSKDPESYIPFLSGYWEIQETTLHNGQKKEYSYNDTVDYIDVSDSLTGTRRKLKPTIKGTYETSKNIEAFQIKIENDSLNIYYKTPYANWKETVINANKNQLTIINCTNKDVYIYKRYEPINLDLNN